MRAATEEPKLESLMWIFPTGCYDLCPGKGYVIGPRGWYNSYQWQQFGTSVAGGSGFINPYTPNQGQYQLQITQGACNYTSGSMFINPNPDECGADPCKIEVYIEVVRGNGDPAYFVYGIIHNYGTTPVQLSLSSGNGWGNYLPSTINIPAGGSYDFMSNPILFFPNANFPGGGSDTMIITGPGCEIKTEIEFPKKANKAYAVPTKAELKISPNPAHSEANISYDTGDSNVKAVQLSVYDAMGNIKVSRKLEGSQGKVSFGVDGWLQGTYIVVVGTTGQPLQAKLLKK